MSTMLHDVSSCLQAAYHPNHLMQDQHTLTTPQLSLKAHSLAELHLT
jgi:hypothetical protein